ncbi:MAG TPA: hypothetical protein DCL44_02450 [Elusimicrobia bacterium]|nr:hypothetical protein [Elusimicrobiota bacterium]
MLKAIHAAAIVKKLGLFIGFLFIYAPAFSEPLVKLALRLQQGIEDYPNIKIAVLEFPYINGRQSDGSAVVQERLTTLFAKNKKITVIERNLLQKVAGELKLQASGAMDETSTQKMGKLLGAEAVLTGTLNDLNDKEVEINARVLIIQTGKIAAAEKITVKKTWKDAAVPRGPAVNDIAAMIARLNENEKYTFKTVNFKSGKIQRTYFKDDVCAGAVSKVCDRQTAKNAVAVELIGKSGRLLKRTGKLPDGFYSEYYDDGALKTVKTLIKSKEYGPLKTYFPGGILQNEAYYVAGKLDGPVKIYGETGKLQFEQDFKNGVSNGYFREYGADGKVKAETFYKDGYIASPPDERPAVKIITVNSKKLARGSEFDFYEEKKYLCKIILDSGLNILSEQGQCPSGVAKLYSTEGKLEKEFVFEGNKFSALKIFNDEGNVTTEKNYVSD